MSQLKNQWAKRISLGLAVLLPIALPTLFANAVQANAVEANAIAQLPTAQPSSRQPASVRTVRYSLKPVLEQLHQATIAEVPPLGNAAAFLPTPDPLASTHLVIRLSDRRVYVYQRDSVKTSFPVAIGRAGWETPTGTYQVMQMLRNPAWEHPFTGEVIPPGADNPLGSRWIAFWTDGSNFIGFHGTPNRDSVGTPASHGCIRMYDQDAVKLFEMVQVGTKVEVVP